MKGMKGWASRRILSYTYTSTCRVCAAAASSPPYSRALADSMYLQEEWVGLHSCIHECWEARASRPCRLQCTLNWWHLSSCDAGLLVSC